MAQSPTIKKINVATASFPYTVNLASDTQHYKLYGTKTLTTGISITPTGTPVEGMEVTIDYTATLTGNYALTVFGQAIPKMLNQTRCMFVCKYNAGAWSVMVLMSVDGLDGQSGNIIIVGNTGIEPLDASTEGGIIVGSGTGIAVKTLSEDVTMDKDGKVTIGSKKVTAAKIADTTITDAQISTGAAIARSKQAALTPSRLLVSDGSGYDSVSAVTATEAAYLSGVTSAIQTQINTVSGNLTSEIARVEGIINDGLSLTTHTEISADTTATAATLKQSYIADTSGGAVYLTLPVGSTLTIGTTVRLLRIGGSAAGFKPGGSDKIYPSTAYTVDQASVVCSGTGKSITAVLRAANAWQVIQAD